MLPASLAAWVPVFMATPTSDWASAGASFVPSPVIATSRPLACSSLISSILRSGVASARKSSTPDSLAMTAAVTGLSPVIMIERMPMRRSSTNRSSMPPLTMSFRCTAPSAQLSLATSSGVPPDLRDALYGDLELGRHPAAARLDEGPDRVGSALANLVAVQVYAAHTRCGAEGDELRLDLGQRPLPDPVLLGEDDDRAALRGLVGERGELCRVGELVLVDTVGRDQLTGLAVPERDRARLVQEEHIDVAGRLDCAPRHREHVAPDEPVHAGDPDRREEPADRRRDQRHEERDEHRHGDVGARVDRVRVERDGCGEEGDGEAGEQDVQRDLVGRLAALGPLDESDHSVQEGVPGLLRHLDHEAIGEQARASSDARAVAAGLADDGRGLTGDRRLVDGADAFDDLAVGRNHLAGHDDDEVAGAELGSGHVLDASARKLSAGDRRRSRRAERLRLRLAAPLGHRFGEIGEEHREPEPEGEHAGEPERLLPRISANGVDHEDRRDDDAAQLRR